MIYKYCASEIKTDQINFISYGTGKENASFLQPETYYTVHTDFFSFGLLLSLLALVQY